jgi:hypothetical protein
VNKTLSKCYTKSRPVPVWLLLFSRVCVVFVDCFDSDVLLFVGWFFYFRSLFPPPHKINKGERVVMMRLVIDHI